MSMLTEIKRPEVGPNADALTSLTRGRGPRRGNLEELLKYWRPIMKKPGGFRRCVVILMDKPQFGGKPQRICAWLHHEITGKWPNEGKGKRGRGRGGKRRSRSVRRVRSAARRAKAAQLLSHNEIVEVSPLRIAVRESRDFGGVLVQPIAGRQSAVDMKAAMFAMYTAKVPVNGEVSEKRVGVFGSSSRAGQAAQAAGTIILPGDISDIRSPIRSQIYETLTPGGGRGLPSGRRLIRGAGRTGRGARNKFRCPPGFQKGGTFTNAQFSTCGAQILGIPGKGVGSPSSGAQRALAALARDASLVREIGDLRSNRNPYDIIRAAQIPVAPKKGSPTRRQISINTVLARADEQDFSVRAVRRDGVILEPVVSLQALGKLDEFDDLADGTLIDRYESGQIGKDIVPAFSTGLRDIYVDIPESGAVRVSRVGGELSPTEVESLRRVFPTSLRRAADLPDPSAAIRNYADGTDGRLTVEFGELKNNKFEVSVNKNELIRVQTAGGKSLTVPRWVYETFLSRSAPRRAKDAPVYEIMSEEKTSNPFFLSTKTITSLTHRTANYHELIEVRAAIFAANRENIQVKRIGGGRRGGRARALFDPGLNRYRCPPGTRYGGRITDQFGRNCGYSLPRTVVNSLVDLGIRIEDAMERRRQRRLERGSRRERLGAAIKEKYDNALNGLADVMDKLANVLDKTEDKRPGQIGPSIAERRNAAQLTDEDRDLLSGEPLADALDNLKNVLDDQDFQNPDIPEIQKAYKAVEKAAGLEAGRLTDNPAKNEKDRSIGRRILDSIASIMDRLANFVDPDTSRRDRRDRRPAASAAPKPSAPKKFDAPRKPEKLDNFSQLSIGGRRKRVDVPELRDLSDDDKGKVDNAIQAEFNQLSSFWANRLGKGINDFSEKDIKKYLKANKNSKDARIERRRYNDWLELNELKRAQDDGSFDGDYEDFVGRLAPNRRDSIVSSIKPPEDPPGDAGDAAGAVDIETPADELPSPGVDYSSQGFTKARGNTPTNEFLMGLSDEDLANYKQAHEAEIAAQEAAGNPPSKVMKDRVTAITMIQGMREKDKGVSNPPPSTKDLSTEGFFEERNKFGESVNKFIKSLTDEELDGYIESFDKKNNDPLEPPATPGMQKARELLVAERDDRDEKGVQAALVDTADLEMGDPDPDGFHPVNKVEDTVNNPDLNDTTNTPDTIINESADGYTGIPNKQAAHKYAEASYDDKPYTPEAVAAANPAALFNDPDFDINDKKTRVGVLVIDESTGKVLLRHTDNNYKGYGWTVSKGGIGNGENVAEAALRELTEETGVSDAKIVGALQGSFESKPGTGSKNYFFVATTNADNDSGFQDAFNSGLTGLPETDNLTFATPSDVAGLLDEDTENVLGKQRDLKIFDALDEWVASGGVSGDKNEFFQTAINNAYESDASPVIKTNAAGPADDPEAGLKHTPSLVPNQAMLAKSDQTGLPLKKVAAFTDTKEDEKRSAAAQLIADVGVVDALNDPEFVVTDFDVNDEIFDAISNGEVDRFDPITEGIDIGINGQVGYPTKVFRDKENGNVYILKKPARNDNEHLSEISAAMVAQDLGLPVPDVTFSGKAYVVSGDEVGPMGQKVTKFGDTTNRPMIIQHVGNVLNMNEGKGDSLNHAQLGAMLAQQYLISEPDNHGDNRVNMVDADGFMSVFAFDAGKAFMPYKSSSGKEEFFGGRFGKYIDGLPSSDRRAVIEEAQKTLSRYDVKSSRDRIIASDMADANDLSPEERGRLSEISDFIGGRHAGWQAAMSKDFADAMMSEVDLEDSLSTPKVVTPDTTPKGGKMVDKNADPLDVNSYAPGIGKVAVGLQLDQDTIKGIQSAPSQTAIKATNTKRSDGMLVDLQTTLDGPDIVSSQMTITDGMEINVGDFDNPSYVKATEFRANLEDHTYDQVVELLEANPDKIYKIKGRANGDNGSKGLQTVGNSRLVQFGDGTQSQPVVSMRVDEKNRADAQNILDISQFHGENITAGSVGGGLNSSVPVNEVKSTDIYVADFGDVKVMLMPDSYGKEGRTKSNMHRQVRVFVTGDSREKLKGDGAQEAIEDAMGRIGIDATPPTEAEIRDSAARRFLRHTTLPSKAGAPDGTYGTGYASNPIQNKVLKNLEKWGISPEDLTVTMASGKPNVSLSQAKAAEIIRKSSGGTGPDALGKRLPVFHHSQSYVSLEVGETQTKGNPLAGIGRSAGIDKGRAERFVSDWYLDGSSSGGLDRTLSQKSNFGSGMSVRVDIANGTSDNYYFTVNMSDDASNLPLTENSFYLFSDIGVADMEAHYIKSDNYGLEHPGGTGTRASWTADSNTPFNKLLGEGTTFGDYTSKGQTEWKNGFGVVGNMVTPETVKLLEETVRERKLTASVLNQQNVVSRNGNSARMMVWIDGADGPELRWGPQVSTNELLTANMTGRLPEIKEPSKDIVPWQISTSGIS